MQSKVTYRVNGRLDIRRTAANRIQVYSRYYIALARFKLHELANEA